MSVLDPKLTGDVLRFDAEECIAVGESLHSSYIGAQPYPHIVMDDFVPVDLLRRVVEEFPERRPGRYADRQSNLKTGYRLDMIESPYITSFLRALNSAAFLQFAEKLTGIDPLVSDPYYDGGGLHETSRAGHLSIHADFNVHPQLTLLRRLNLILFLNEDWNEDYGGHLELWKTNMESCAVRIAPVMGRAVIFNTDRRSFHGHPDPLKCPDDRYRRSMALYYYTIPAAPDSIPRRTTNFQVRPRTSDKRKLKTQARELARDLCPPLFLSLWRRWR